METLPASVRFRIFNHLANILPKHAPNLALTCRLYYNTYQIFRIPFLFKLGQCFGGCPEEARLLLRLWELQDKPHIYKTQDVVKIERYIKRAALPIDHIRSEMDKSSFDAYLTLAGRVMPAVEGMFVLKDRWDTTRGLDMGGYCESHHPRTIETFRGFLRWTLIALIDEALLSIWWYDLPLHMRCRMEGFLWTYFDLANGIGTGRHSNDENPDLISLVQNAIAQSLDIHPSDERHLVYKPLTDIWESKNGMKWRWNHDG